MFPNVWQRKTNYLLRILYADMYLTLVCKFVDLLYTYIPEIFKGVNLNDTHEGVVFNSFLEPC